VFGRLLVLHKSGVGVNDGVKLATVTEGVELATNAVAEGIGLAATNPDGAIKFPHADNMVNTPITSTKMMVLFIFFRSSESRRIEKILLYILKKEGRPILWRHPSVVQFIVYSVTNTKVPVNFVSMPKCLGVGKSMVPPKLSHEDPFQRRIAKREASLPVRLG